MAWIPNDFLVELRVSGTQVEFTGRACFWCEKVEATQWLPRRITELGPSHLVTDDQILGLAFAMSFDLDLNLMGDEVLVVLAKECGYLPARNELILRFHQVTGDLIAVSARRAGLPGWCDDDDAKQNAVFAIIVAIGDYDTAMLGDKHGRSFRSFLYQVVSARFMNFVRSVHRQEKRVDRHVDPSIASDTKTANQVPSDETDQSACAERREVISLLHEFGAQLPDETKEVWDRLLTGAPLTQIADDLSISYDAARWRYRKLVGTLASRLRGLN